MSANMSMAVNHTAKGRRVTKRKKGLTYKLPCAIDGSVVEFCFCIVLDLETCFDVFDGCCYERYCYSRAC